MKYKAQEVLDGIVDEFVKSVECYLCDAGKIISYDMNPDDMRKLAKIAYELGEYAEQTADEAEGWYEQ